MRTKRSRMLDIRTKVHIFTGGLKEDVAQIELRGGELIDCLNYQEIDGVYHGYSSIPGYEVTDGTTLASEVDIVFITDYGNDRYTKLLLECDNFTDKSSGNHSVVASNVIMDTDNYIFVGQSYAFGETSTLTITHNGTTLDMGVKDTTFDLLVRPTDITGSKLILEKLNSYKLTMESGYFKWWFSTDGITYDKSITSNTPASANARYHVELDRKDGLVYMFVNGTLQTDTETVLSIFDNSNNLVIGGGFLGNMEEIRLSETVFRHLLDFDIPETVYSVRDYYTFQVDDIAREARRSEILPIPGSGNVLGVKVYNDCVYGVRNAEDGLTSNLWCADDGWQMMTGDMNPGGAYRWTIGKFPELVDHQRESILFFTSGTDTPKYLDDTVVTDITHANLPDDDLTSFYATNCIEFKSRLFLAYPDGRLIFSAVDNPLDFDPVSGAGEIFMEDVITEMIVAPGDALIVYCESSTYILKALSDTSGTTVTAQYKFSKETFSKQAGAFPNTAQRTLSTVISMNERGITNLEATDTFGDFASAFISKNVQVTLMKYKDKVTAAVVQKANNQYRIFFSEGTGLYFTFDSEKKLKGVTKIKFETPVICASEGVDAFGNIVVAFGSLDGYVYLMDSGTSFNGRDIKTKLSTSFDSYQSPGLRKRFRNISLELKADKDMEIFGSLAFDYGSPGTPRFSQESFITEGTGGIWGVDRWGSFTYGSAATKNPTLYSSGYGKNMSLTVATTDKYRAPHVLNAAIVKYSLAGQIM